MASKVHNIPLRVGVPYWVGITIMLLLLIPNMMLNGAYTGCAIDISSSLGVLSEDISMTYYAASAGMAITYPLIPFFRKILTTKSIIIIDLLLQILLAIVCARAVHIEINMICSFFIGILRAFLMLEIISTLMPFFSPNKVRSEFYAYFYPIVFGMGSVSTVITAYFTYSYQWQFTYYLIIALDLIGLIAVVLFFRFGQRPTKIPWRQIDFESIMLISCFFMLTIYAITYGKTLDWFSSEKIVTALLLLPPLLWLFIHKTGQTKYVDLSVLKSHKAIIGYFFMSLAMLFNVSSSLVSTYTTSVLRIDSVHSNMLSLWAIPGYMVGAFICFWWLRFQKYRFRVLIFWGMSCFTTYFAILYFGLMPNGTYEFLILPTIFKGIGMMIIFIAFGVYAVEDIKPQLMIHNAFFLIAFRSVLIPVLGSALFSNLIYRTVQAKISHLGQGIDMQNVLAMNQYDQSLNAAIADGNTLEQASQVATNTLYNMVQIQATVASVKEILGWFLLCSTVIMVVSRFVPFHKVLKVKLPQTDIDMA